MSVHVSAALCSLGEKMPHFVCVQLLRETVCRGCCFFFFSSRRRHTRCSRDWSSDVCSSDLGSLGSLHESCQHVHSAGYRPAARTRGSPCYWRGSRPRRASGLDRDPPAFPSGRRRRLRARSVPGSGPEPLAGAHGLPCAIRRRAGLARVPVCFGQRDHRGGPFWFCSCVAGFQDRPECRSAGSLDGMGQRAFSASRPACRCPSCALLCPRVRLLPCLAGTSASPRDEPRLPTPASRDGGVRVESGGIYSRTWPRLSTTSSTSHPAIARRTVRCVFEFRSAQYRPVSHWRLSRRQNGSAAF